MISKYSNYISPPPVVYVFILPKTLSVVILYFLAGVWKDSIWPMLTSPLPINGDMTMFSPVIGIQPPPPPNPTHPSNLNSIAVSWISLPIAPRPYQFWLQYCSTI